MKTHRALLVMTACFVGCGPTSSPPSTPMPPPAAAPTSAASPVGAKIEVADAGSSTSQPAVAATPTVEIKSIALAGATDAAFLDYIGYDHGNVWVPFVSGKSGFVDVFDSAKGSFSTIGGFKTVDRESHGKTRSMGPSSVTFGNGFVYVGNRGTSEICIVDAAKGKIGACVHVASAPDGLAFVASAHELWVTTPASQSITIFDVASNGTLKAKTSIKTAGDPEGYAVDAVHDLFFTNLEDKSLTLSIDVKTHKVVASWPNGCGADGPRGIASDGKRQFVVVACTDHLQVLDAAHAGALLSKLDTGPGVDNIDLSSSRIYAGAGKAGKLTIASLDDHGDLTLVASTATADGARNAVSSETGDAYVVDGKTAHLIIAHVANAN